MDISKPGSGNFLCDILWTPQSTMCSQYVISLLSQYTFLMICAYIYRPSLVGKDSTNSVYYLLCKSGCWEKTSSHCFSLSSDSSTMPILILEVLPYNCC